MSIQLRGYQLRGAEAIRAEFRRGRRAVLYVLSTGAGKTVLFTYIAANAAARGNSVCILVHRRELLSQASLSLAGMGVRHGVIAPDSRLRPIMEAHVDLHGGSYLDGRARVHVASIDTMARPARLSQWANKFSLIIPDEAHHCTAASWARIIESSPQSRVLGVTATPCRTDGQGLGRNAGGIFDAMVVGPSIRELIDMGYLVQPVVYAPPNQLNLSGVRKRGGDYAQGEIAARVDKASITGDAVDHYRRLCDGRPAIAFCCSVMHAEHVAQQFAAAGYRAASVDGKTEDNRRRQLIAGLGDGRIQVLTACDIISEGTDIPVVQAAILLRPTQSETLFLQQVGRALRPSPGKDRAIILDHVGNCITHGLPDEVREWTLDGRAMGGKQKETEGGVRVLQCPVCYAAHSPAPHCPACGHRYETAGRMVDQVDGELAQITEQQAELIRRKRRREVGKAATLEEFQRIAQERGYKPAWATHMYEIRKQQGRAA